MQFENTRYLDITTGGFSELVFDYVPQGAIHEIAVGRDGRSSLNDGYQARLLAFKSGKAGADAEVSWEMVHVLVAWPTLRIVHPSA